jgi:methionyl aminopeptidase
LPFIPSTSSIHLHSAQEIERATASAQLAAKVLSFAGALAVPGTTTNAIDEAVHEQTIAARAVSLALFLDYAYIARATPRGFSHTLFCVQYPSPLNYSNFPKSVCTSINDVVCHGIPDDRPLEDGDIINIDVSVFLDGFHGDTSRTFLVGEVDVEGRLLVSATERILQECIDICAPGVPFNKIGATISEFCDSNGYDTVHEFCGHGVGREFHQLPTIYHYANSAAGTMQEGMVFTIEPMLTEGTRKFTILSDGWTAATEDGKRSAQFEHTVLITAEGAQVLTIAPPDSSSE